MDINYRLNNNTLFVNFNGELDEHTSLETRRKLDELFNCSGFSQIVLDLTDLEFMDSTGIGVIIGRYKKMKDRNIPMFITNPSSHVERIFKMTGIYNLMPKIS